MERPRQLDYGVLIASATERTSGRSRAGDASAGIDASMRRGAPGFPRGDGMMPEGTGRSPKAEGAPQASPEVLTVILGSAPVPVLE